jgi:hypothetical protein
MQETIISCDVCQKQNIPQGPHPMLRIANIRWRAIPNDQAQPRAHVCDACLQSLQAQVKGVFCVND